LSLIEVVVVTAVVGVALGVLLPAIHAAQIFARRARTLDNLKMIGLAMHNYASANLTFPMSAVADPAGKNSGVDHSGFTALLPYLEQAAVYNAYNFDWQPYHASNATAVGVRIATFLAVENKAIEPTKAADVVRLDDKGWPGKNGFGPLHFGLNWGGAHPGSGDDFIKAKPPGQFLGLFMTVATEDGKKAGAHNVGFQEITDGTSNTLAAVEKRGSSGWAVGGYGGSEFDAFTAPAYTGDDAKLIKVFTGMIAEGGPRGLMADGSARVFPPTLRKEIWYALLTRSGGEIIPQGELDAGAPTGAAPRPAPPAATKSATPTKGALPSGR
jgi:type II secretory pathway pseudopilin PulG